MGIGLGGSLELDAASETRFHVARSYGGGIVMESASVVGGVVRDDELLNDEVSLSDYSDHYGSGPYYGGGPPPDSPTFVGAGLSVLNGGSITDTDVHGNTALEGGGGIAVTGGELHLVDVPVHRNTSGTGGGVAVVDATLWLDGSTEIFENAAAVLGSGTFGGGGVVVEGTVVGGTIRDNEGHSGVGMFVRGGSSRTRSSPATSGWGRSDPAAEEA